MEHGDTAFVEREFHAGDDLALYYRDYGDPASPAVPVLCLAGLTRNSADFHRFALRHRATRRIVCLDYRGRGKSARDPDWRNYRAEVYLRDIVALMASANLHRVVVVGTSLGGILAMALGAVSPSALAGVVLNDIGPEVALEGRDRILDYVGRDARYDDLAAAAEALKQRFGDAYPDYGPADWHRLAETTFVEDPTAGNWRLNYDLRLAKALAEQMAAADQPDLWAFFRSLAQVPLLVLRGALSDVLSADCLAAMAAEIPALEAVTVANRGHVPDLTEPPAVAALDRFLGRF